MTSLWWGWWWWISMKRRFWQLHHIATCKAPTFTITISFHILHHLKVRLFLTIRRVVQLTILLLSLNSIWWLFLGNNTAEWGYWSYDAGLSTSRYHIISSHKITGTTITFFCSFFDGISPVQCGLVSSHISYWAQKIFVSSVSPLVSLIWSD